MSSTTVQNTLWGCTFARINYSFDYLSPRCLSYAKTALYANTSLPSQQGVLRQTHLFYSTGYDKNENKSNYSCSPPPDSSSNRMSYVTGSHSQNLEEHGKSIKQSPIVLNLSSKVKQNCILNPSPVSKFEQRFSNTDAQTSNTTSCTSSVEISMQDGGNTSESGETVSGSRCPEPTLSDLDRSIPQVDCEFIANLARYRTIQREFFLKRKLQLKTRVEELSKREAKTITEAASMPRVGGLGSWRRAFINKDETALMATDMQDNVIAPEGVLAKLTSEELDILHTTRPEYEDGFILLDCRTVNEITSWGVIEGAKVLPAHEFFEAFHATPENFLEEYGFSKPNPNQMIICYCQYGPRSLMAAQILSWMGYLNVLHFRDGYYEWSKQYNLLLRRWMEHDRSSGNELRRVATFRAALEMQREIAPEFTSLAIKEASRYYVDTTRSPGRLRIGEGLRAHAYSAVAKLIEELPLSSGLSGQVAERKVGNLLLTGQHLTNFFGQATGLDPAEEKDTGPTSNMAISEAQTIALAPISAALPHRAS